MGQDAEVRIEALHVVAPAAPAGDDRPLLAAAEPGARLARTVRFNLALGNGGGRQPTPLGYAVASVFVAAPHVRASRAVARGETLAGDDLVESRADVGAVRLQHLPGISDLVGARALRDLLADEVVTRSIAGVRPLVQSGDAVSMRARAEGVVVQAPGVATQSGDAGDVIRVINRESRRPVKARVVERGTVEVIQ
jgi:flagella basal body P-ring formation protein FlgA